MMKDILKEKFGDCKFQDVKPCDGSYINVSDTSFYIFDPPNELNEPIRLVTDDKEHQLIVGNTTDEQICIVRTDKCLLTDAISKCDCLLFHTSKFYFVEIKSVGIKSRSEQRHVAVNQLGATVELLQNANIDFSAFDTRAVICFKSLSEYPVNASKLTMRAIFREKYSIDLVEGNKIEF